MCNKILSLALNSEYVDSIYDIKLKIDNPTYISKMKM